MLKRCYHCPLQLFIFLFGFNPSPARCFCQAMSEQQRPAGAILQHAPSRLSAPCHRTSRVLVMLEALQRSKVDN